ncbi:MAG: class I SAM-dependent methyltransferase [Caldilineaceae bacterium]
MFTKSAEYYDAIYAAVGKNYEQEAERLHSFIQTHKRAPGNTLLDIACGTGAHLRYLRPFYTVEGLDADAEILAVAQQKFPDVAFHQGDMVDFNLGRAFAVVTCLFSSIGYVKTLPRLQQAIQNLAAHTLPSGLVLIEPWFSPGFLRPDYLGALLVDQSELKVARISRTEIVGNVSLLNFHYLIATPEGVEYKTERHELGLFTHEEYLAAFTAGGLTVVHDAEGLDGRGLYIGVKPL